MKFDTHLLFFFGVVVWVATSASVPAIQSSFPFRTGRFYVIYPGMVNKNIAQITFDIAMSGVPASALVTATKIQYSQPTSNSLQFLFTIYNFTTSTCTISTVVGPNIPSSAWTTLIGNYFLCGPGVTGLAVLSQMPSAGFYTETTADQRTHNYFVHTTDTSLTYVDPTQAVSHFFFRQIRMSFGSVYQQRIQISMFVNQTIKVVLRAHVSSSISQVTLCGIFMESSRFNIDRSYYDLDSNTIVFDGPISIMDLSSFPFPNIFMGLHTVISSDPLNKVQYCLEFDGQTPDLLTFDYLRSNPQDLLVATQATSPPALYIGNIIYFMRVNCSNSLYSYLEYQNQLCHDICPFTKYPDSAMRCQKCFLCSDIADCDFCFQNSCVATSYFDIQILPYKCTSCGTVLTNCTECFANSTGQYCTLCDPLTTSELDTITATCQEPVIPPPPIPDPENNESQWVVSQISHYFAILSSIPTIQVMTTSLYFIIDFIDLLSYYNYHSRNYSSQIRLYIEEANNFTLSRFIPDPLRSVYSHLKLSYSSSFLTNNLNRSPEKLLEIDGSIHFLNDTQDNWTGSIPLSVLTFLVIYLIHKVLKGYWDLNWLYKYNYFSMILASIFIGNIKYFSFRCFSQLFQTVPLTYAYYLNMIVCYAVLFLTIVYSMSCVEITSALYCRQLGSKEVRSELFEEDWVPWFIVSNLLDICIGLVHGYFYYEEFAQSFLLLVCYLIKAVVFSFCIRKMESRGQFVIHLINYYLICILQSFFVAELFLIKSQIYTQFVEECFGKLEETIIIVITVFEVICLVFLKLKLVIEAIISSVQKKEAVTDPNKVESITSREVFKETKTMVFGNKNKKPKQSNFSWNQFPSRKWQHREEQETSKHEMKSRINQERRQTKSGRVEDRNWEKPESSQSPFEAKKRRDKNTKSVKHSRRLQDVYDYLTVKLRNNRP